MAESARCRYGFVRLLRIKIEFISSKQNKLSNLVGQDPPKLLSYDDHISFYHSLIC